MTILDGYRRGVNLGGWISQYPAYSHDHFRSFIKQEDIDQIASWGMDHVRLPIDYPVLEDDSAPGVYKQEGFAYIDQCLEWCDKAGLNVMLDMHMVPGYSFTTLASNTLFDSEKDQQRLIALWEYFARRYIDRRDNLMFELMNEVVEPNSIRWNALVKRMVAAIRAIDPTRVIVYGGNFYNSINELKNLDILDDERILYNFHFYLPMILTHQRASWNEMERLLNQVQDYPGMPQGIEEYMAKYPDKPQPFPPEVELNRELVRGYMEPAVEFMRATGRSVYCGEYGVIDHAPMSARLNWHRDVVEMFNEMGIGRAVWSYKLMGFAMVDGDGKPVNDELIQIVSR